MSGGTGRAGLTVVGQVVGSYFGPIGSMIGGMIGSAIGSALWPEQIEGPKLGEFQAMTSTYGAAIPLIWGGMRVGGNVFWCSPIREVEVTEEQGKGGGAEMTYTKRYADVAVGLCLGEIIGIRKIWNNQKLVYDLGDDADIGTIYASLTQGGEGMRFYPGSATQLPDPVIEAVKGVGSTPAYRGLAYIVFENLELGTSFPNITAEVIRGGTTLGPRKVFENDDFEPSAAGHMRISAVGAEMISTLEAGSRQSFVTDLEGEDPRIIPFSLAPPWPPNQTTDFAGQNPLLLWNGPGIYVNTLPATNTSGAIALTDIRMAEVDGDGDLTATGTQYAAILSDNWRYLYGLIPCVDDEHVLCLLADADATGTPTDWVLFRLGDETFTEIRRGTLDTSDGIPYRSSAPMTPNNGGASTFYCGMLESDLTHAWQAATALGSQTLLWEIGDDDVMRLVEKFAAPVMSPFQPVSIFAEGGVCWVARGGFLEGYTRSPGLAIDLTLDDLVSDCCQMAGLGAGQIDVTDLASVAVQGFILKQLGTARAAIEPLMTAYGFDAVESDGKIKFVMRHATPAVEIPSNDLGAGEGSASESLVQTTRTSEPELPMLVEVSYMAPHADYQVGAQRVTRGTTESRVKLQVQLPLSLSDQEAIEIAYRIAYEGWTARYQREWATTVKYAKYEPTDVVDLEVA